MKNINTILLTLFCAFTYAQQYYLDSTNTLKKVPSKESKLSLKNDHKTFTAIGLATAPCIGLYAITANNNTAGRVAYGSMAIISLASLSYASYLYINEGNSVKPFFYYSFFVFSGLLEGVNETINNKYWEFKKRFPNTSDQFWDPKISWENKYHSSVPFARSLGVFATDGHHLTNWTRNMFILGGVFTFEKPVGFKNWAKKTFWTVFSYSLGKGVAHCYFKN